MKITWPLFPFIIALVMSSFSFSSAIGSDAAVTHYGSNNRYAIGSAEDPVYVYEYVTFLNQSPEARNTKLWFYSDYYDSSFMTSSRAAASGVCILRQGAYWYSHQSYSYSALAGHENDIIEALFSLKLQQEFTAWRVAQRAWQKEKQAEADRERNQKEQELTKNPTEEELANYINDKMEQTPLSLKEAAEIEGHYPKAAQHSYFLPPASSSSETVGPTVWQSGQQTLWQQVDSLVTHLTPYDEMDDIVRIDDDGQFYKLDIHHEISNEACNEILKYWGLALTDVQDDSSDLSRSRRHVVLLDESNRDAREPWATLIPTYDGPITFEYDVVKTEKIGILSPLLPPKQPDSQEGKSEPKDSKWNPDTTSMNEQQEPKTEPSIPTREPEPSKNKPELPENKPSVPKHKPESPKHKPSTPKHKPEAPKKKKRKS